MARPGLEELVCYLVKSVPAGLAAMLVICQLTMVRGGQDSDCGFYCLEDYTPICAQLDKEVATEKTFSNKCFLRLYNCQNKSIIDVDTLHRVNTESIRRLVQCIAMRGSTFEHLLCTNIRLISVLSVGREGGDGYGKFYVKNIGGLGTIESIINGGLSNKNSSKSLYNHLIISQRLFKMRNYLAYKVRQPVSAKQIPFSWVCSLSVATYVKRAMGNLGTDYPVSYINPSHHQIARKIKPSWASFRRQ
uniref:Uncharacterized protein n=1 Tax=Timema tahoe TaxID=61484 RepID=A0A7R9FMM4_9NEOP|nr:unnamed protein product [Timema tahoe]